MGEKGGEGPHGTRPVHLDVPPPTHNQQLCVPHLLPTVHPGEPPLLGETRAQVNNLQAWLQSRNLELHKGLKEGLEVGGGWGAW